MHFITKINNKIIRLFYPYLLKLNKCMSINENLTIDSLPIINIKKGCRLEIGRNVRLNSYNYSYHINMHSPVKLIADRKGAIIKIGDNTRIHGSCIHAYKKISIASNCLVAANCQIFDGNGHDLSFPDVENRIHTIGDAKEIAIEDNVWIGANCIILPGVRIGYGSVISAGSVVNKSIPAMCIAGGNPAKVLKFYEGMK